MQVAGLKHFKEHRADILAMKQAEILGAMTEGDVERASLKDKATAFGSLYDKERLERGKSTENVSVHLIDASLKKLEEEEARLKKELGVGA